MFPLCSGVGFCLLIRLALFFWSDQLMVSTCYLFLYKLRLFQQKKFNERKLLKRKWQFLHIFSRHPVMNGVRLTCCDLNHMHNKRSSPNTSDFYYVCFFDSPLISPYLILLCETLKVTLVSTWTIRSWKQSLLSY